MTPVRVLAVASEIYPLVKTGGLADVTGALPGALKAEGIETRTLVLIAVGARPPLKTILPALTASSASFAMASISSLGGIP